MTVIAPSSLNPSQRQIDLHQINRFLVRWWRFMVASTIVTAAIALAVCLVVKPTYSATAQVLLDPPKKHVLDTETTAQNDNPDSSVVDSQIPLIMSNRTLLRVISRENLLADPEFNGVRKVSLLSRLFGMLKSGEQKPDEPVAADEIDPKFTPVIGRLYGSIDVVRVAKSNVLSVTASAQTARKAMRLANAIAQTYVDDEVSVHVKSMRQMGRLFEEHIADLRDQVRNSENAVASFRREHGLATTTDEKVTVSDQEITSLNEKLTAVRSETADKRAKYLQAKEFATGSGDPFTLHDVIDSVVINQLRAQQADVMRREADMRAVYGPLYPPLRRIQAQHSAIETAIGSEKSRLVSTLKNDYEVSLAHENSIRAAIASLSNPQQANGDVGVRLRELERTNLANKVLFENFLSQSKLTQEQPNFEMPDARVISPALEPAQPSSPKIGLIVPLAGMVGLIFGAVLAGLLENLAGGDRSAPIPGPAPKARAF